MNPLSLRRISVAAGVTCALLLPIATVHADESPSAAPSATPIAAESQAFTVGITQDVDSMNPFTGIVSTAYEMYQLMYPTLTEYSADDFSPGPGLAESWEESADQTSWTYKIRPGLKWSDGQPLTARDAAYTFNRIINGDYEQTNYGSYVANITKAEATDDTTLVLTVDKPSPIMENLAVYILPEHIWKDIDGKQVQSYKNEPRGPADRRRRTVRARSSAEKGEYLRFEANPNYYGGTPAVDELVFRVYKNTDAIAQALRKGEIDFADDLAGERLQRHCPGSRGHHHGPQRYSGFNEIGVQHGCGAGRRHADRRRQPGAARTSGCARRSPRRSTARPWSTRCRPATARPGTTIIPPLYADLHLEPTNAVRLRPGQGRASCSTRPATRWATTACGSVRTAQPLTLRLLGRQESADLAEDGPVRQGLAGGDRHRRSTRRSSPRTR